MPWTNESSDLCGAFSCESVWRDQLGGSGKNSIGITLTALHFSLENLKDSLNPVESSRFVEVLGSDKA